MTRILLLPGWQNSGPEHWQSRWEALYGDRRVEQHDWFTPRRGDWMARLDDVLLENDTPAVLVAHSLGCILAAAWASHSLNTRRVAGALLVAPGDPEREDLRPQLPSWSPIARQRLPFPCILLGSSNDPYCSHAKARELAHAWGCRWIDCGARGHLNAESALGDWPEGRAWLQDLVPLKRA
jgi:uncharacterized protein